MTGISEILVLVLLIACILILPRLFKGDEAPGQKKAPIIKMKKLGTSTRIGIVVSFVYPVAMALYLRPWDDHIVSYLSLGIFPVLLAWALIWILAGKKV